MYLAKKSGNDMWTLFTVDVNLLWKFWLFSISMEYRYNTGSLGAILLLGKRENLTWPWRQSLQGEFPHCVFLFFLCFVFLFCLCFVILYLSRSLQLFAMPWLHSPPRWTVLCVRCHLKTFNPEQEYWKLQLIKVTQIFWYFCTSRWNWITLTLEHT